MFFRRRTAIIADPPVVASVHQLADEEIVQRDTDIVPVGAGFGIEIINKEDALMVEKLKAYLAELETKKAELLATDFIPEIEAKVAAFKESLIKESEDNRAKDVAKVDSDIACINKIIENELALAAAATVETVTITE